jgi:hypothetical protein
MTSQGGTAADLALWRPERWIREHYLWCALGVLGLLVLNELSLFGTDLRGWDWLLVTGLITLIIAARIALTLPTRVHEALDRLARRSTLCAEPDHVRRFEDDLHHRAKHSGMVWTGIVPIALLAGWVIAKSGEIWSYAILAGTEAILAALLAGPFVGRAISYARLGARLGRAGLEIRTEPAHLDGAAGLRPVGDLYFFQALVLAVPAAYLGAWWYVFPLLGDRYSEWSDAYVGLLAFVVALEILAFVAPLWTFHVMMARQKDSHLEEADEIAQQAAEIRRKLTTATGDARAGLQDELASRTERYEAIEAMPTWPVNVRLRRRFTVNNLALVIPVAAQALGLSDQWQRLLQGVQKAFGA